MSNLRVFKSPEFGKLEVMMIDGKEHFPSTDVAKMLCYGNPHKAVNNHCRYLTKREVPHPQNPDKLIERNFIPEGDVYRLIIGASSQGRNLEVKAKAEQFERWVFDEVLPDIRNHGLYAPETVIDNILKDPELGIRLFTEYKEAKERAKRLELENAQNKQIIGELRPKASYYDLILQNKSVVPISLIAKDYGLSARKLNSLLHELGIQYRMGKTWLLYQKYAEMGYTQSKTHVITADHSVMHTYWTQKGRLFLYEQLKREKGLVPLIERSEKSA